MTPEELTAEERAMTAMLACLEPLREAADAIEAWISNGGEVAIARGLRLNFANLLDCHLAHDDPAREAVDCVLGDEEPEDA